MRLSLIDNDSGFGDVLGAQAGAGGVLGGGRHLDIVGTMGKSAYFQGLIPISTWSSTIKAAFNNRGWSVSSVDLIWDGQRYRFRISAWVRNEHSDGDVRDGARAVLLSIKQGVFQAFDNVYVGLEQANTNIGPNTGGNLGSGVSMGAWSIPASLNASLSPLAVGLGVTTGTVLLGGILIAIIILKRS